MHLGIEFPLTLTLSPEAEHYPHLSACQGESQRDSILQPRVARNELPWVDGCRILNPERVEAIVLAIGARGCNPFRVGGFCERLSQGRIARPLFPSDPTLG
jgi:hypothetical protein